MIGQREDIMNNKWHGHELGYMRYKDGLALRSIETERKGENESNGVNESYKDKLALRSNPLGSCRKRKRRTQ